jgi:hypothetical protein
MKVLQSMWSLSLLLLCAPFCRAACDWASAWHESAGADASEEKAGGDICWFLLRDAAHADHPAQWVQLQRTAAGCPAAPEAQKTQASPVQTRMRPMIRAGDGLLVEETSDVLDAHLEATALEPAFEGAVFRVRLEVNGKAVWARATDAKHATLVGAEKRLP